MNSPEQPEPRRRWGWVILLLLLAGIGALGWHTYTGLRAERQLRDAGIVRFTEPLRTRLWSAARYNWRLIFKSETWQSQPDIWKCDDTKARKLRNLDAVAPALRRVNPTELSFRFCYALENVDGLEGLSNLRKLDLAACESLRNVDGLERLSGLRELDLATCVSLQNVNGLKGLSSLRSLDLRICRSLQTVDGIKGLTGLQTLLLYDCPNISESALRELRSALPRTDIMFPSGFRRPSQ